MQCDLLAKKNKTKIFTRLIAYRERQRDKVNV